MDTRREVTELIKQHYGHTLPGTTMLTRISAMDDDALEEFIFSRNGDIATLNDCLVQMTTVRDSTAYLFTPEERALDSLQIAVDTLLKTANVLEKREGDVLAEAAAILDNMFKQQVDYIRAKRIVLGVQPNGHSRNKAGHTTPSIVR